MLRYSVRPRDIIFAKCYGSVSFAENMGKTTGENKSKTLSGKYSHKFDYAKKNCNRCT